MARTKKLPENKKISVMVPAKMTPPEHKLFLKLMKEDGAQYATQMMRKIVVQYLNSYKKAKKAEAVSEHTIVSV